MNSFNHYSLGSVGDWLFGRVAGIDQAPDSVAYSELLLRPLPGGTLTWARAEQETARGRIACGWSLDGEQITVTVTTPPGTTAVLEVPTTDPTGIRIADQDGLLEQTGTTLRLASGHHVVTASFTKESL
jgi:alpha-L-rhamnosidase